MLFFLLFRTFLASYVFYTKVLNLFLLLAVVKSSMHFYAKWNPVKMDEIECDRYVEQMAEYQEALKMKQSKRVKKSKKPKSLPTIGGYFASNKTAYKFQDFEEMAPEHFNRDIIEQFVNSPAKLPRVTQFRSDAKHHKYYLANEAKLPQSFRTWLQRARLALAEYLGEPTTVPENIEQYFEAANFPLTLHAAESDEIIGGDDRPETVSIAVKDTAVRLGGHYLTHHYFRCLDVYSEKLTTMNLQEYVAAHIHLPEKDVTGSQFNALMCNVVDCSTSFYLQVRFPFRLLFVVSAFQSFFCCLQIWCTAEQAHDFVRPALLQRFGDAKVFLRYLWQSPAELLHGFVVAVGEDVSLDSCRDLQVMVVTPPSSGGPTDSLNVSVPLDFIQGCTQPEAMVADFMCGSGSAAVAAAYCGRHSVSVDINATQVVRRGTLMVCFDSKLGMLTHRCTHDLF